MTYIVTFSKVNDKLETETWFDQRPTHREVPAWLIEAREATDRAQKELDEFHETYGASTEWTTEQAAEFEHLLNARNDALEWERDCIEINTQGAVPASIQYAVQMREDAR
jgi:hypothetical protein